MDQARTMDSGRSFLVFLRKGEEYFSGHQLMIPIKTVRMNFSVRKSAKEEDDPWIAVPSYM